MEHSKHSYWLDTVEIISAIASVGGAVASVVSQQVAFASIPLSLSVALNLANRRRIINEVVDTQNRLTAKVQQTQENGSSLGTLSEQLKQVQQLSSYSSRAIKEVGDRTESLEQNQKQLEEMLANFGKSEHLAQAIEANPNSARFYFSQGLSHQRSGEPQKAIEDYSEAIRLHPSYAEAYHHRGILDAEVGNKQQAVDDLRKAAKFYFEQENLDGYQKARDLAQEIHALNSSQNGLTKNLVLENFFA